MERQEGTDEVGDFRLEDVAALQFVEAGPGSAEAQLGWRVHQAELGIDVCLFLIVGEGVPGSALSWVRADTLIILSSVDARGCQTTECSQKSDEEMEKS